MHHAVCRVYAAAGSRRTSAGADLPCRSDRSEETFLIKAGAQRVAAELGILLVAPDTSPRGEDVPDDADGAWDFGLGAGFYLNATEAPWSQHYRMYDYVTAELPAVVGDSFPADLSRQGITGHSMGGHGALTIGLKNPDLYRSVSAFAPICSPVNCPWGQKAFSHYLGDDREAWRNYDASELVRSLDRLPDALGQIHLELVCEPGDLGFDLVSDFVQHGPRFPAWSSKQNEPGNTPDSATGNLFGGVKRANR